MAMLLPAVQVTREAARRTPCQNNLPQVAAAAGQHPASIGRLPKGGWGFGRVGDSDRGCDENQPGGFSYNCLPFLEHQPLHVMTAGLTGTEKRDRALVMVQIPPPVLTCPGRRPARAQGVRVSRSRLANTSRPTDLASGWYPADSNVNGGLSVVIRGFGPTILEAGDAGSAFKGLAGTNGVSHQRSRVHDASPADGAGNTSMIVQKRSTPTWTSVPARTGPTMSRRSVRVKAISMDGRACHHGPSRIWPQ